MSASKTMRMLVGLLGAVILFGPSLAFAAYDLNLTKGVTVLSEDLYKMHMIVLWICVIVGIGVFGVMIYSIINHRKSKGAKPASFHESTTVEVIWTIIPFIILVIIAVPATKYLLEIEDTSNPDMNIKVVGWQWKWEYDYIDEEGVSFFSNLDKASNDARMLGSGLKPADAVGDTYLLDVDNPIVVPVGKKVRLLITANDVIHAWWVPELGVKRDAIPGFVNESWFRAEKEGVYRGQCAELCGKDHGFMPIVVKVVSEADYKSWISSKKQEIAAASAGDTKTFSKEELMARGKEVYDASCAACHGPTGAGIPGVFPGMTGSKIATGDIQAHIDIVVKGKPGTAMQAFGPQLSKADIAAVVTYERNALGNSVGDMVQPSEINK
jgi:cytochrome c oxidase subunit 2